MIPRPDPSACSCGLLRVQPSIERPLRRAIYLIALCLLLVVSSTPDAYSQANQGNILGLVTDQTSSTVVGATVTVTNVATEVSTTAMTDTTGRFSVPFLPPGTYRVKVEAKGFKSVTNPSVSVHAQQSLSLDFTLQVGSVRQVVSVSAQSPLLQTSSSNTGQTVPNHVIQNLPLLNRNLLSIALIGTGMQPSQNGISHTLAVDLTGGVSVTADGLRDTANQYTIDGANVNIGLYNYPSFVPIPDAVQEFSVLTGNYSAEFGQYAGAHINYVLKSGTNAFHGSVFEYLQNNDLNARNYFSPTVPTLRQNQFGGVFGGPIRKNHAFFMVSYQGLRQFTSQFQQYVFVTQAQRNGDLSLENDGTPTPPFIDPETGLRFPGNQIPSARISQQAKAALALEPLPNQAGADNFATFASTPTNSDDGLVKVDDTLTAHDQLSGRFLIHDMTETDLTNFSPLGDLLTPIRAKNIALIEIHTFSPTAVLSSRASWNRQTLSQVYPSVASDLDTRQMFNMVIPSNVAAGSRLNAYPYFNISGYTGIGTFGNSPLFQQDQNYEIASSLAVIKGNNNFQTGFELDRYRSTRFVNDNTNGQLNFAPTNPAGTGNALADFLLGLPTSSTVATSGISVDLRRSAIDLYITDKYSVTPRLTVEAGLRYELNTPVNEHNGRLSLFNFTAPGSFQQLKPGDKLWHGDLDNFAPRLGLTYRLTHSDVIRAGGGIYYSNSPQLNLTFAAANPPFISTFNFNSAVDAPLLSPNPFPLGQQVTGGVASPFYIEANQHTPAAYEWMVDVQHSVNPTLLLDLGYQGNRAVHFGRTMQLNVPLTPGPGAIQSRRPLPSFGSVSSYQFDSFSTYESLQARVDKRLSHGLSFLASYTWSKNLDVDSDELTGGTVIPTDLNFDYGPSDFDISQNLTLSYVYELPFGAGRRFLNTRGIVNEVIGGWQLSGVTTFRSGFPFTVTYPGDVANVGLGTRPNRVCSGRMSNRSIHDWFNLSCFVAPPRYTFGDTKRGTLFGPGYKDWDMGLMKRFQTFRDQYLTFRAEFYNIFNNVNFGQPNATISTPGAGQITSAGPARIGQFGLDYHF